MKVDGAAFKKARQQIRKEALMNGKNNAKTPAVGTQEWLADLAEIRRANSEEKSLNSRTIQYLERGEASLTTIEAVSFQLNKHLGNGFNGYEHIIGYGDNLVTLSAPSVMDFRPTTYPPDTNDFYKSSLVFTIDPLTITLTADKGIDKVKLIGMTAILKLDDLKVNFKWLYRVALNPTATTWLGVIEEVYEEKLVSPATKRSSIMFAQQEETNITWGEFVDTVGHSDSGHVQIDLVVEFENFVKKLAIAISTKEMKIYFKEGKQKRQSDWPFFVQPKTIVLIGD